MERDFRRVSHTHSYYVFVGTCICLWIVCACSWQVPFLILCSTLPPPPQPLPGLPTDPSVLEASREKWALIQVQRHPEEYPIIPSGEAAGPSVPQQGSGSGWEGKPRSQEAWRSASRDTARCLATLLLPCPRGPISMRVRSVTLEPRFSVGSFCSHWRNSGGYGQRMG